MSDAKRVSWIDAARGIGIIAIVLGHAYLPVAGVELPRSYWALFTFVYAFHVPLFMVLSGLVFKPHRFTFPQLIWTRATRIGFPYLLWASISALVFLALGAVAGQALGRQSTNDPLELIQQILFANPSGNGMRWNTPLWFLTALLIAQLAHWLIARATAQLQLPAWTVLLCSVGISAVAYFTIWESALPWSIERAFVLLPFFTMGALVGPAARAWHPGNPLRWTLGATVALGVMFWLAATNGLVDYVAKSLHNPILWFAGAWLGILGIVAASIPLSGWRWLTWLGRASLTILVVHKFPLVALQMISGKLPVDYQTAMAPVMVILMTAVTLGLSALVHPIIMKWLPEAVGSKRERSAEPMPRRAA